jgi:hypothetical protein
VHGVELLAEALLLGVGPLVNFKLVDMQVVELQDEAGYVRHLQCWDNDSLFEVGDVWKHLYLYYNLHKTMRKIWIHAEHWHNYLESQILWHPGLELLPPNNLGCPCTY